MVYKGLSSKRVWYEAYHIGEIRILQSFAPGGKLKLGGTMVDGRTITSIGWEGRALVVSAEYR